MSTRRHGVVGIAVLDVRKRPEHRAEMSSQLLLGETVEIERTRASGWAEVVGRRDQFRGWVRDWGFVACTASRARRWEALASARITEPIAWARTEPEVGGSVSPLFWNSVAIPGPRRRGCIRLELPDGRRGWVPVSSVSTDSKRSSDLGDRASSLLGIPYLWGGRSPAGFDCSGLVQQLLWEQGIRLPRNAADQARSIRPLRDWRDSELGDLLFFASPGKRVGHVGVALGGGLFLHARGRVMISSMRSSNPLYDKALAHQFRFAGTPLDAFLSGRRGGETA